MLAKDVVTFPQHLEPWIFRSSARFIPRKQMQRISESQILTTATALYVYLQARRVSSYKRIQAVAPATFFMQNFPQISSSIDADAPSESRSHGAIPAAAGSAIPVGPRHPDD